MLEGYVDVWAAARSVPDLRSAFSAIGKLGVKPGGDLELRTLTVTTLRALSAAYLPLVPSLRNAYSCVIPLWACAAMDFWGDGLAAALLRRLSEPHTEPGQRAALLHAAEAKDHAKLWWSLSQQGTPPDALEAADGVLDRSAAWLAGAPTDQLVAQDCSNVLLACARLQWYRNPGLVHSLTASLGGLPDARPQHLSNALYSLGELADDCGHQPRPEDLRSLAVQVLARLQAQFAQRRKEQQAQQRVSRPRPGKGRMQRPPEADGGRTADGFIPRELSAMLLGCCKMGYDPPALLRPLAAAAALSAPGMKPQEVCNSLQALSRLGCTDPAYAPIVQRLCYRAHQLLHWEPESFEPQNLSNLLLTLARLRPDGYEEYAVALAAECWRRCYADFKPQEIRDCLRALDKMGLVDDWEWYRSTLEAWGVAPWPEDPLPPSLGGARQSYGRSQGR